MSVRNECGVCKKPSVAHCVNCKVAKYCSENCQKVDWKRHRLTCDTIAAGGGAAFIYSDDNDTEPVKSAFNCTCGYQYEVEVKYERGTISFSSSHRSDMHSLELFRRSTSSGVEFEMHWTCGLCSAPCKMAIDVSDVGRI